MYFATGSSGCNEPDEGKLMGGQESYNSEETDLELQVVLHFSIIYYVNKTDSTPADFTKSNGEVPMLYFLLYKLSLCCYVEA